MISFDEEGSTLGYIQDNGWRGPRLTRAERPHPKERKLMWFVLVGVALILMRLLGIGPVASWNFELFGDLWKFCLPFGLAMLWWIWADVSGLNKRREMEKMEARKRDRRKDNLAALGMDTRARRKHPR
jgi:small Trp-rich protein